MVGLTEFSSVPSIAHCDSMLIPFDVALPYQYFNAIVLPRCIHKSEPDHTTTIFPL